MTTDNLHLYVEHQTDPDQPERYRWSFVVENGNILADSGQSYADERDALHGFSVINRHTFDPDAAGRGTIEHCALHKRECRIWFIQRIDISNALIDAALAAKQLTRQLNAEAAEHRKRSETAL